MDVGVFLFCFRKWFVCMAEFVENFLGVSDELGDGVPFEQRLLAFLLQDKTTRRNLRWATDYYSRYGVDFTGDCPICINQISGPMKGIIKPRRDKSRAEQSMRSKGNAEVFTPSWLCNAQNNLIDCAWFGRQDVFNQELDKGWETIFDKIDFPTEKTWKAYVLDTRLEVSCGEAPYLVSRHDTVSGEFIPVGRRVGFLDRKLRIVAENVDDEKKWLTWARKALQNVYGYDWQGDNVLLARQNLLYTIDDFYFDKFGKHLSEELLIWFARVVVWNVWQMDGIKFVVPNSCRTYSITKDTLFGSRIEKERCNGCHKKDPFSHNGIYCNIMDWKERKVVRFVDLLDRGN